MFGNSNKRRVGCVWGGAFLGLKGVRSYQWTGVSSFRRAGDFASSRRLQAKARILIFTLGGVARWLKLGIGS